MKAVILAGGKGSLLAPYTTVLPKPLMPIVDMPILEIVLKQLKSCGIADIVIAVGYLAPLIRTYFGDGSGLGTHIEYVHEESPLGTAGPLGNIEGLDESFLVMNGDILTDLDYSRLVDDHRTGGSIMTIATHNRTVKIDFGVLEAVDGYVSKYIEKPSLDYLVSMGVYVMEPAVRKHIKPGVYLDLPDLVRLLIASGERVRVYPFEGRWLDIGRQEDFNEAQVRFEEHREHFLK
jgi:NDP-sugar pyrophosphorylase family protein